MPGDLPLGSASKHDAAIGIFANVQFGTDRPEDLRKGEDREKLFIAIARRKVSWP
jgi:hypothetical protein